MPAHCLQETQEANEMNYHCFVAIAAVHGSTLTNFTSSECKSSQRGWSPVSRFAFPCSEAGLPRELNVRKWNH